MIAIKIVSTLLKRNSIQRSIYLSTRVRSISILPSQCHGIDNHLNHNHVDCKSLPIKLKLKNNNIVRCNAFATASSNDITIEDVGQNKAMRDEEDGELQSDKRIPISPEVSIRYMKSKAYRDAYAHYKVWELYRRNFKTQWSPLSLRPTCLNEEGVIRTSNPCPICRDEYLILDYTNVKLLDQFLNQFTGEIYPVTITGLCHMQYERLLVAIRKAYDHGLISFQVPFREYDYNLYYPDYKMNK